MMTNVDPNVVGWTIIAIAQAATAYFAWSASKIAKDTKEIAQKTELNTNSMKDALVKATSEAAHAAGVEQQRAIGEAKAATLAQGVKEGKEQQ